MPKGVYTRTLEARKNIGKASKGRKNLYLAKLNKSCEHRELVRRTMLGRVQSKEEREQRRLFSLKNNVGRFFPHSKGAEHYNWKGGITAEREKIRISEEFRNWRNNVFKRDKYTCQKYGTVKGDIVAHHILNFAEWPELRMDINNGITLSGKAHKQFHKKYGYKHNTREQLIEFLN